jgi:hypothetical protein
MRVRGSTASLSRLHLTDVAPPSLVLVSYGTRISGINMGAFVICHLSSETYSGNAPKNDPEESSYLAAALKSML